MLFAVASRVALDSKRMRKLEKDYMAKRSKEQEEAIELRVGLFHPPGVDHPK